MMNSPPRVRVVHVVASLKEGGAEAMVRSLCRRLPAHGIDTHVVSVYECGLSSDERHELGVPLHEIHRRSRSDIGAYVRLASVLHALRPDVVHGHVSTGKFAGRLASVAARVPNLVFTEHGDEARGVVQAFMQSLLNRATRRFIVFTDEQQREFARNAHIDTDRIAVIPNGVELPSTSGETFADIRRSLDVPIDVPLYIMPARLAAQKNQALAVRAIAELAREGRRSTLIVVGQGPDLADLQYLAAMHGISTFVRFVGWRDDVARLVRAADAFLMPSLWERMPLALGEAMRLGVPVVSTPWDGVRAFLDDGSTGYISADYSVDGFAAALRRAADDPQRALLVERARDFATQRFDPERMTALTAALYRSLTATSA